MPYVDLGRKEKIYSPEPCTASKPDPKKKEKFRTIYPSFSVRKSDPMKLKIGTEIEVKVKLKVSGLSKDDYSGDGQQWRHEFEVVAMDMPAGKRSAADDLEDEVERQFSELGSK